MRAELDLVFAAAIGAVLAACGCSGSDTRPPGLTDVPLDAATNPPHDSTTDRAAADARPDSTVATVDGGALTAIRIGASGTAGVDRPSARRGHAMAYDQKTHRVVLFGGYSDASYCPPDQLCGDTWEWDVVLDKWLKRSPVDGVQPSAREQHAMIYDPIRQRVLLFGGTDNTAFRQDTWEWDSEANSWTDVTPSSAKPSPRQNPGFVWDVDRQRAVLFGGGETDGANPKADTWEWDGTVGIWLDRSGAAAPSARQGHGMAYDQASQLVLVFGGNTGSTYLFDTWEYNAAVAVWAGVSVTGARPSARFSVRMEYDLNRQAILLYGGITGGVTQGDVWVWERAWLTWNNLGTPQGMPSRYYHATAYDTDRKKLVVFGGINAESGGASVFLDDLWEM